jgi:Flp pilus assembly protein TadD
MLRAKASSLENCTACQSPGFPVTKGRAEVFQLPQMNSDWVPPLESQGCDPVTLAPVPAGPRIPGWLLAVLLALVTVALYWPATDYDFINYDDNLYVSENVHVQNGLSLENIKWAFLNPVADNWHPLTVLSHMLVCQGFGLNPWAHHLVNVLLHALNAVLVFVWLRQATGATWRSLLVAALFAVHPLRLQSVVWVSERKDVLSGFFFLLTLIAYTRYAGQFKIQNSKFKIFYGLALFFFALGLMSKPMLVTLPFVLLLVDYWPLGRIQNSKFKIQNYKGLLLEKIPFLALAVLDCWVTFVVQKRGGSLGVGGILPFDQRFENALVSYCRQLGKLFWPTDLAILYPLPGHWPLTMVLLAGGLLFGITAYFVMMHRCHPFLLMGWFWFCGMLVPVIGLVQTGMQAMADRHTYLPSLGVFILVVWGADEMTRHWRCRVWVLTVLGSMAILSCIVVTQQQIGYWQDSETVFRHALDVTKNNYIAHGNLGEALAVKGDIDGAIRQFQEAIQIETDYPDAQNNLGIALGGTGRLDEAIQHFQEAIRYRPNYAEAHHNLGVALGMKGRLDEAIVQYQIVIGLKPDDAEARNNLGIALASTGRLDEAVRQFQAALRLKPEDTEVQTNLTRALKMKDSPAGR